MRHLSQDRRFDEHLGGQTARLREYFRKSSNARTMLSWK
jgi:hypothetical protein